MRAETDEATSNDGNPPINQPYNEGISSSVDANSESVGATRNIRSRLKHSWVPGRGGIAEAWVLLDADGNTQQVTENEVNILLGGRSVDTVLATIPSHPVPSMAVGGSVSDTDRRLDPIIQESLLLLRRENVVGECSEQKHLGLERKAENMLMHITQPQAAPSDLVQIAPSVHFVDIEPDRILQWRHSQDFYGGNGNSMQPFICGRERRCACDHASQETDDNNFPLEIHSEVDPTEFYHFHQLNATKSSTSLKKKGMKLLSKLVNKSKAEDNCSTGVQSERGGIYPLKHNKHAPTLCSVSSIIAKLEENASKYKEMALRSERRVQEEVREKFQLQLKLAQAKQKESNLNGFLAKEQENRSVNYTSSPIYDLISITEPESNFNIRSTYLHEQALHELKREIHDLKTIIFDSENLVKQSIIKYIADKQLEKQLLHAVGTFSRNKIEGEQKVISVAHDMLDEQATILKQFRQNSESQLSALKKRVCLLEDENILLLKKIEKLQTREIRSSNEASLTEAQSCQLNNINYYVKSNEKLREKVNGYQARIEKLEIQLQAAQDKSEHLENLVRSNRIELENQKMLNVRLATDHEMDCSATKSELAMKSRILDQTMEVAGILVDDIQSLRTQLEERGSTLVIEWNRLQIDPANNCLADLLSVSRNCINGMGRELITLQKKIKQASKEILSQHSTREKLEAELEAADQKKSFLQSRLQEIVNGKEKGVKEAEKMFREINRLQEHLSQASHQIMSYEEEIKKLQRVQTPEKNEDVLNKQMDRMIQRALTTTSTIGLDTHIKKLTEDKYHLMEDLKIAELQVKELQTKLSETEEKNNEYSNAVEELQHENSRFKNELLGLHEQQQTEEISSKMYKMEKEMYKLSAEKACLADKLQDVKTENKKLLESSHSLVTQSQCFQFDMDMLMQENAALKMQHDTDHSVLLCLGKQARLTAGDDDDGQTSAINIMQSELVAAREKVQKLESTIESNTKKIKELEKELARKDEYINDLDVELAQLSNVDQLEILTLEQNKEQMEINISSLNRDNQEMMANITIMQKEIEYLTGKLQEKEKQLEKFVYLEKELESNYDIDFHRREENSELKGRLKDFNNLMNQRDKLIENQREFLVEAENLHSNIKRRDKKICSLTRECAEKTAELRELEEKLQSTESLLKVSNEKAANNLMAVQEELQAVSNKLFEYERHFKVMDQNIDERSCNLVGGQSIELQTKAVLEEEVNHLKNVIDGHHVSLDQALKQIGAMRKVEKDLRYMVEDERKQRYETEEVMKILEAKINETFNIVDVIDREKEKYTQLNNEFCQYKETVAKFNEEIEKKVRVFQQELVTLNGERDSLSKKITEAEKRNHVLEEKSADFEKNISDLTRERSKHMEQMKCLLREMKDLGLTKYQFELTAMEEKRSRESLELNHKDVSARLLEAIRLAIYEKTGRERIENQCHEFDSVIERLLQEKKMYEETIVKLKENIHDQEKRVQFMNDEKFKAQYELRAAMDKENNLKITNERLRKRCAEMHQKLKETNSHETGLPEQLTILENGALGTSQESTRLYEERLERLTNQLTETRYTLLSRRQDETGLRKTIVKLQSEKSQLNQTLCALERRMLEETYQYEQLQKTCQKFLDEYDTKSASSATITTLRHLVSAPGLSLEVNETV